LKWRRSRRAGHIASQREDPQRVNRTPWCARRRWTVNKEKILETHPELFKGATGYTFLENLYGSVDPGNGATRLEVGNPVSSLILTAYGSKAPGILGGSAGVVSLAGPFLVGSAGANEGDFDLDAQFLFYPGRRLCAKPPPFRFLPGQTPGLNRQTVFRKSQTPP
jgi:hypothetical protein